MEAKTLYVVYVLGWVYSTHETEWEARNLWSDLDEKQRASGKILVFTEVRELEL